VTLESDFFDGTGHRVLRARAWILRVSMGLVAVGWPISMDLRLVVVFAALAFALWLPPMVKPINGLRWLREGPGGLRAGSRRQEREIHNTGGLRQLHGGGRPCSWHLSNL
jgi:hypothetical protein